MSYAHVQISACQSSKRQGQPCGDAVGYERTTRGTTLVCSDGIGSGLKANLAATMTVSRLQELLRRGYSLWEAVANVSATMIRAKQTDLPYACFTVARVRSDGEATLLGYEMPPAIFISNKRFATVLPQRTLTMDSALVSESSCYVEPGEALLMMSDGITQAGLGTELHEGWQADGVCRYVNSRLSAGLPLSSLAESVHFKARSISEDAGLGGQHDDCTAIVATCRPGKIVNVLTGPPTRMEEDAVVARRFLDLEGQKVVCGGTTAKIVARVLGQSVDVRQDATSMVAPPDFELLGVDLATEGAVTLNQAFNILDADRSQYEQGTGVSRLCEMLLDADRVLFLVGGTTNIGHDDISFRQRGILLRETIVPLLADKLQKLGKLVTVEFV
jgi:hypothetical protein